MSNLTKNQELSIEYVLQGMPQTTAVEKVYNCKNKNSAGALATKLFKQEKVKNRLKEKQALLDEKTTEMTADFITLVKNTIKPKEIISKINELSTCGDKRTELSACDMYLKIIGGYKDKQTKSMDMFDNTDISE